ncbi:hypothetical protein DID88_010199 [Monilinia fructigena]|uniref:Uncharacterized protein n=1 Tax=Monilinia fructigena TaxID=38457 RepID=A0A395IKS5_9HELO|nr:hypothetical protein DID88_010199 [Monilinia fructigena]
MEAYQGKSTRLEKQTWINSTCGHYQGTEAQSSWISKHRRDDLCVNYKAGYNEAFVASEKFYLVLYVVKTVPVTELVRRLEYGKKSLRTVDEYVKNILQSTSRSVDQVTVEPEGQWKLYSKPDAISSQPGDSSLGGKRPISEVIDLTSSGDEEEPATRPPPKRQYTSGPPVLNGGAPAFRPNFQKSLIERMG